MTFAESIRAALARPASRPSWVEFCGIDFPLDLAKLGFLILGRPRSGKTSIIVILLLSAAPSMKKMLCFDYKNEYGPLLRRLLGADHVIVCAPFEPNSARWRWAGDINSLDDADAFGELFAPVPPDQREPFFAEKASDYYKGVLRSLHLTRPNDYDLGHVNHAFSTDQRLVDCMAQAGELNARFTDALRRRKGMNHDVRATIDNRISEFEAVQRRFERLTDSFTLTDWAAGNNALVVGHSHRNKKATGTLTRALLQRATDLLLDEPGSETPHTWVFLDELQSAGKLELTDLLSKGGSKGIVSVLGFHSISTLRKIYGPDGAAEFGSYNAFKCFCGLNDFETAKWVSDFFGEQEQILLLQSESVSETSEGGRTRTSTEHLDRSPVVSPQDLLNIPPLLPPRVTRLGMYVATPFGSTYYDGLSLERIKRLFPVNDSRVAPEPVPELPPPSLTQLPAHESSDPDEGLPYWS